MIRLHRSDHADALVRALAEVLSEPPADPFAREIVAVPTRGMERWLTQQLSAHLGTSDGAGDGVCAAVEFPLPGRLLGDALAGAADIDPETDPWRSERLTWPLLQLAEELADESWMAPLARHLRAEDGQHYARIAHLASLYHRYEQERPELIETWLSGSDSRWQAELWRHLRERLGVPSPAERLGPACARLADEPELVDIGERPAFFGLTRLSIAHAQLLSALAQTREVHLMLLHPSPALWDTVAALTPARGPRRSDPSAKAANNRLLASWGRDVRELQILLGAADSRAPERAETSAHSRTPERPETPAPLDPPDHAESPAPAHTLESRETPAPAHTLESPKHPADTLLAAIQRDVRADRQPPGPPLTDDAEDERMTPAADDQSLRIHACHGRARQVEVLREAILHRLQADPSLEPRDVIVMCPDIEEFAPLIQATFADGLLPLSLADRSPRQTNPLLAVAARLMELAGGRLTVSEVLDLIDMTAVRLRFGFSDDDLTQIRGWANDAQIHWGIDDQHRSRWKLEGIPAGTWRQGLSRLLLATALPAGGTELYGGTLGAADIDSSDIELAGSLAELVDRLDAAVSRLTAPAPLAEWIGALGDAVDSLAAAQAEQAWQRAELGRLLDDLLSDAGLASDVELTLADVRTLLTHALAGRPTRANFRSGRLTVCTMHPMRSIPHRVICLLGMDDHAYPRRSPQDGDDALMEDPHVGDRDPRAEDRQLLLDALMAAEDALIITYSGNDERTNAPLPPAVPIGELLDAVDATAIDARTQVLVRHPLQPFDPKNFSAGALTPDGSWSFDPLALTGAKALLNAERTPAEQKFLPEPLLPPAPEASIALEDLIGFVERPARAFLRQRLGVSVARWEDEVQDELPVEFDALERYGVGQRLLEAVLAGVDWAGAIKAEIARGTLPPGELGRPIVKQASGVVAALADRAKAVGGGDQQTFETNVQLPDGRRVTGTVSGVRDRVLLSVSFARLNPRHRLAAWVRLLALSAAHPDTPWEAITIGKGSGPANTVALARISSLGASTEARAKTAISELTALVDLRAEGLCRPLAIPAKSAEAWVRADAEGEDRVQAALNEWKSGYTRGKNSFYMEREDAEPEHALVFGPELPMAQLEADAPRLWTPLRARERIEYS